MDFQFTHPGWLWLLVPAVAGTLFLAFKSDVPLSPTRKWIALVLRMIVLGAMVLALAGLQWKKAVDILNVVFLLDRSDSVPSPQQEAARDVVVKASGGKRDKDRVGVVAFGAEAALEANVRSAFKLDKVLSVVGTERTDIASALRLGTAAFPESGQKRLVLFSDGNENAGDALAAIFAARPLGVTLDVVPLGINRQNDISIQKLGLPARVKKGQTFEVKIFAQADRAQTATLRLYRNEQFYGEQKVQLERGRNLYTFSETLAQPGFYSYNAHLDGPNDTLPQNNRASGFVHVRGEPRVLLLSADPKQDAPLRAALSASKLEVTPSSLDRFPSTLAELQSYEAILLSNVAAGELGEDVMKLIESAVRDFGVGLVCIGGEQTYAAGGYRGTPLENALPVDMELSSKKVLPSGALVLVVHATEFPNGNQWARDIAFAALDALGAQDEMGIVLWDGNDRWLFPLARVGDKKAMGRQIAGMNPGDMPGFANVMRMGHESLKKSTANLKHMVVFSDGDPGAPGKDQIAAIVGDKITISTVMIGGHVLPDTMQWMAAMGNGRFYDVRFPGDLPQIFIKEAAVILKSAIYEEPFRPQLVLASELVRGIASAEYPQLRGYVATTAKPRAEIPLLTDKGDPLLAHWQYGLGRAVAFTSDARAKWAANWLTWEKYRQFWSQVTQWSLRRIESADLNAEVSVEKGEGHLSVEATDAQGNYRNFLNLQTVVVSPKGEKQTIRLEQTGPGRYEARFPTREVGAYLLNLMDLKDGQLRGSQVVGASVNYSPEFIEAEPNESFLRRLADAGGGKIIDPRVQNPFLHDRHKTFQAFELWEWLLKLAILVFPIDVAVRRIQIDREEWARATQTLRRCLFFWRKQPVPGKSDESLSALLSRRDEVRSKRAEPIVVPAADLFRPQKEAPLPDAVREPTSPLPTTPEHGKPSAPDQPKEPASTTDKLLDAKRRARKKME